MACRTLFTSAWTPLASTYWGPGMRSMAEDAGRDGQWRGAEHAEALPADEPEASIGFDRLSALLRAQSAVAAESDLRAVLRRVVFVARALVPAGYAAVRVTGGSGALDEFAYSGMDPGTAELIGQEPGGHGVLGLPGNGTGTVRLADLRTHPAFTGFPSHHPAMAGFLGVPIGIRGRTLGALYLSNGADDEFDAADEWVAGSLAGAAAAAIDHALLCRESAQADRWSAASAEVARQLLTGDCERPLEMVLRHARDTASADFAVLTLLVGPARLQVEATVGAMAEHLAGVSVGPRDSVAAEVAGTGTPVLIVGPVDGAGDLPSRAGSTVVVPLTAGGTVLGTINIGRVVGAPAFTDADVSHLAGFAACAGPAMELRSARADRLGPDDHDRIGADLNEHVIREMYAVALALQGLASITTQPERRNRITGCIDRLDEAIKRIRIAIFTSTPSQGLPDNLHHRLLAVVDEHTSTLHLPIGINFSGVANQSVPPDVADDLLVVVRGALTDIARHTATSRIQLRVDISEDVVVAEITSNGRDVESPARTELMTALRRHARTYAGTLRSFAPADGGSHLMWTAHIPQTT
jgi:two-component system, NarL family, sensor histidine kinase DevS